MQPFDDRTPDEMDTHHAAIVSFLGRVYAQDKPDYRTGDDAMESAEQEQAIAYVRQRLLQLAQTSPSLSPGTTIPERKRTPAPAQRRQKSWQRHMNILALVAVMIVLIGSSVFVFGLAREHQQELSRVSQTTTDTYIAPTKSGNRLIGDMLYADQTSRNLLFQQQFTQINQSQMVDGYQITLDRAYVDANILILGIYAVMPYGPKADKDGNKDAYFLPMGDHIRLATTNGVKFPVLDFSMGSDMGNSQHEQRGLLLDFDTAAIAASPAQVTLNLQMAVHCQGWPPNYQCPRAVNFAFTLPFHASRQVITPHQAVTMNGTTFTLERVVITPSEARVYIGGWSEAMFKLPSLDQKHSPQSFYETWYNIKLSVKGKTYNLCTLQGPLNCPQGAQTGPSTPLHSEARVSRDSHGNLVSVNTGVSFLGGGEINPVYLNNNHTILGVALLEPFNEHGQATVIITKQLLHFVEDKKNKGTYTGTTSGPVDDKSTSPWAIKFTLL